MKELEEYYTDIQIIKNLCRHRAKMSHARHKKHMLRDISKHNKTNKIHVSQSHPDFLKIQKLFPTRRNWKKLNKKERLCPNRLNNSIEKNTERLWKSYSVEKILVEKDGKVPDEWYINLLFFCSNIREKVNGIFDGSYFINKPEIFSIYKSFKQEKGKHIYRPIAQYSLEDKIITSGFAKYLTEVFDQTFLDCSFAFRARKNNTVPSHHDSIVQILKYKKKNKRLWVSECDIQKFFDTVQHEYLISIFFEEIKKLKQNGVKITSKVKKIFLNFLNSYSFNRDVLPKNNDLTFFKEDHEFGWNMKELKAEFGENYTKKFKIGVPQGNAVSCFIANLILNRVDQSVLEKHKDILYVRYCDDMIIAHPNRKVCKEALETYKLNIKKCFLLFHEPKKFENYEENGKYFWTFKSKEPYYWGNKFNGINNVPWLSFVGYQINYKREIRVRKDSINKEIKKQISETQKVLVAIGMDHKQNLSKISTFSRKSKRQLIFSLQQRLISMSTGRVTIYNYNNKNFKQDLCWSNGFRLLNKNKIAKYQLKKLDNRREQQISYFKNQISNLEVENNNKDERPAYMKKQKFFFGKPFSYSNLLESKVDT